MSDTLTEMQREIEGLKRQLRQFASGQYSGVWTAYTPTPTNFTLGNGTMTAKYRKGQGYVEFDMTVTLGSTSVMGTSPYFSLPVTPTDNGGWTVRLKDPGNNLYLGTAESSAVTSAVYIYILTVVGTALSYSGITATSPFTWATGDAIVVHGIYGI